MKTERFELTMSKSDKDKIKRAAKSKGLSMATFILWASMLYIAEKR